MAYPKYDTLIDKNDPNVTYFGFCEPGGEEGSSVWRILRKVVVSNVSRFRYAEGSREFKFKWSERTLLSY